MEPGRDKNIELHKGGYRDVGLCTGVGGVGSGGVGGSVGVDGIDGVGSGGVGGSVGVDGIDGVGSGGGVGCGDSDGAGNVVEVVSGSSSGSLSVVVVALYGFGLVPWSGLRLVLWCWN